MFVLNGIYEFMLPRPEPRTGNKCPGGHAGAGHGGVAGGFSPLKTWVDQIQRKMRKMFKSTNEKNQP